MDAGEVIAFAVANGGSQQIQESWVLSGLGMSNIVEAMSRSQTEDDGIINRWLIQILIQGSGKG